MAYLDLLQIGNPDYSCRLKKSCGVGISCGSAKRLCEEQRFIFADRDLLEKAPRHLAGCIQGAQVRVCISIPPPDLSSLARVRTFEATQNERAA